MPDPLTLGSADGTVLAKVDTQGGRIASLRHEPTRSELLLVTPWADEDWSGAPTSDDSAEEWHRRYPGGWHSLLPSAGDARIVAGVRHPFHGEAAWRTWRVQHVDQRSCDLEVELRTVPFVVRRTVDLRDGSVRVTQVVRNLSTTAQSFTWTEHPALGADLLSPSTTVEVDGRAVPIEIPSADGAHGGFTTVTDFVAGRCRVSNPERAVAVEFEWDAAVFPFLFFWQEHRASPGFLWFGRVSTMGVEPASRPYRTDSSELGPLVIAPHAVLTTTLRLSVIAL